MDPIAPIAATDPLLHAASTTADPATGPSMDGLLDRFQSMLSQRPSGGEHVEPADGPNMLSQIANHQQESMHRTHDELEALKAGQFTMNPVELQIKGMEVSSHIAQDTFRMEVATSFASSLNKNLQTLLKGGS